MSRSFESKSKFLSLVLRHKPEQIGLKLDENGWADVDELLARANQHGVALTQELLQQVVATNDKKRFTFDEGGSRIRANQGHSIRIDLKLDRKEPPPLLFHGTATRFLASIRAKGLLAGSRQHVHLSALEATAQTVGARHGKPVVLHVLAQAYARTGAEFFLSDNGVWLVDHVPVEFIRFPDKG